VIRTKDDLPEDAIISTDRSRIEVAEHCMRKRYWSYEHDGRGIEKPGEWLDPLIGTAVHNGIEAALGRKPVEDCVAIARETMLSARRVTPINVFRPGPDPEVDFNEGMSLAEALLRGWVAARLDRILQTYQVVMIERELTYDYHCEGRTIRQLTRPDIVMKRLDDGSVFIMNLKTTSRVDQKWRDKWRYDMTTFSEALAVEEALREPVAGTIMAGLVKGSRQDYPKGSGNYHWDSPLVQAWKREGEPPMTEEEWYARFEWSCTAPHVMGNGRRCPGGKQHRLSGVHKAMVAERLGGVSGWISYLAVNDRALLEEQFVELTSILRSPYEVERWKRQRLPIEVAIREHRDRLRVIEQDGPEGIDDALLDRWFPMTTSEGNCVWPSTCPFSEICWGVAGDDLGGHGFVPRTPNHPETFDDGN
jgi:hypothetical protein